MDGSLCPFGGHVEEGETPLVAMIREINEELGVTVKPEDIDFGCVAARNTPAGETVAYEFIIRNKEYVFMNAEPEKCSELVWIDLNNLPHDIIDQFKEIIERGIIAQESYVEIGY